MEPSKRNSHKGKGKEKEKEKKPTPVVLSPYFSKQRHSHSHSHSHSKPIIVSPYFPIPPSPSPEVDVYVLPRGYYTREREREREKERERAREIANFNKFEDAYKRKSSDSHNTWIPPPSKDGEALLQEKYYEDPWKVLIICILLNRTRGCQAARVIADLFKLCPNAKVATEVETEKIQNIITPLGLQYKRSAMIQQFSKDYLRDEWTHVTQLHGIGKYAADAYAIFCNGCWKDVNPDDHKLVPYWQELWNSEKIKLSVT